jgi:hypothetical protein
MLANSRCVRQAKQCPVALAGRRPRAILFVQQLRTDGFAPAVDELGLHAIKALLKSFRQHLPGVVHAHKQCVATTAWNGLSVELRAFADLLVPRRIGMPTYPALQYGFNRTETASVPEPTTTALLTLGLVDAGLGVRRHRLY